MFVPIPAAEMAEAFKVLRLREHVEHETPPPDAFVVLLRRFAIDNPAAVAARAFEFYREGISEGEVEGVPCLHWERGSYPGKFDPGFNCPTHFAVGDPTCGACISKQPRFAVQVVASVLTCREIEGRCGMCSVEERGTSRQGRRTQRFLRPETCLGCMNTRKRTHKLQAGHSFLELSRFPLASLHWRMARLEVPA